MTMIKLNAQIRKDIGRKVSKLRKQGIIPAVLYGSKEKNVSLQVNEKEFDKIFMEAGESTLINMEIEGASKKYSVLVNDVVRDALSQRIIHIDFYQPRLDEEISVTIPLIFEGLAPAVKDLGGTLVKNIREIEVRALPQNLPHEIKVSVESLNTFEDNVFVKDLPLPKNVKVMKDPNEVVALVMAPTNIEEELARPLEEKVEDVEKVEKKKEEEVEEEKTE